MWESNQLHILIRLAVTANIELLQTFDNHGALGVAFLAAQKWIFQYCSNLK